MKFMFFPSQKLDFIDAESVSIQHIVHLARTDNTASKDLIKIFKVIYINFKIIST